MDGNQMMGNQESQIGGKSYFNVHCDLWKRPQRCVNISEVSVAFLWTNGDAGDTILLTLLVFDVAYPADPSRRS
jgi:hypothetical protein